jgi:hypothetical protein
MKLFKFHPDLAKNPDVEFRWETSIDRKKKGGEVRETLVPHMLRSFKFRWYLEGEELQELRHFFDDLGEDLIGLPDWTVSSTVISGEDGSSEIALDASCFRLANWRVAQVYLYDRKTRGGDLVTISNLDSSGNLTIDTPLTFDAEGREALPLRLGRITDSPDFPAIGDMRAELKLNFIEVPSSVNESISVPSVSDDLQYLSRPVWLKLWEKSDESWIQNVAFQKISFGKDTATTEADESKRRLSFSFVCKDADEVASMIQFFDSRKGRNQGFWTPSYRSSFKSVSNISAGDSTITIENVGLSSSFGVHPGYAHLFLSSGGVTEFAEISSVVEIDSETEEITLNAPLSESFEGDRTTIGSLLYVRFASDDLKLSYTSPSFAEGKVSMVELPKEYGTAGSATEPIYLYEISGYFDDKFTSYGSDVLSDGDTFTPENINHGEIAYRAQSIGSSCRVEFVPQSSDHPINVFQKGYPVEPLSVTIYEVDSAYKDTRETVYKGNVRRLEYGERGKVSLSLGSPGDAAETEIPTAYIEPRCSRQFLNTGCNLEESDYLITGEVLTITGNVITADEIETEATAQGHDDWFLGGRIKIGNERRSIVAHSGNSVTVSTPFVAASTGDECEVLPGCNRSATHCKNRFSNFENFGGAPFVPPSNPQLEAIRFNSDIPEGGKK